MSEIIVIQESTEVVEVSTPGVPGPAGVGVPTGGTAGQVLTKDSGTDYDTSWQDSAGNPDAADVDFTPAGNLASTDVQAALEELDTEKAAATHTHAGEDITSGTVADARIASTIARDSEVTSAIATSEAGQVRDGDTAGGVLSGTYPNPGFAVDMATQAELDAHVNDTTDAHDASAISADSTTLVGTGTDVQAVLEELDNGIADHLADATAAHAASAISASSATLSGTGTDVQAVLEELDNLLDDHSSRHEDGGADEISIAGLSGTPAALQTHLDDTSDAHDASAISIVDAGNDFTATDVEGALAELQADAEADATALSDHIADGTAAHAASAISASSATLSGTGTDVQAVLEELDNLLDDHSARHENGGADEISVAGLSGELADAQPVTVRKNTGADVGTRSRLNFIEGTNVTLTVADDAGSDEIDITIAASSSGGSAADDESLVLHVNLLAI